MSDETPSTNNPAVPETKQPTVAEKAAPESLPPTAVTDAEPEQPAQVKTGIGNKPVGIFRLMSPEAWISSFALFVSMLTVWLSCNQFAKQQDLTITHDKLSVKPVLQFNLEYTLGSAWMGVSIVNKGLGPAIISETTKRFDETYFYNWGDLYDKLILDSMIYWKIKSPLWNELYSGQVISPDETVKMWYSDSTEIGDLEQCKNFLLKLKLSVKYKNIYEDTFSTATK